MEISVQTIPTIAIIGEIAILSDVVSSWKILQQMISFMSKQMDNWVAKSLQLKNWIGMQVEYITVVSTYLQYIKSSIFEGFACYFQ